MNNVPLLKYNNKKKPQWSQNMKHDSTVKLPNSQVGNKHIFFKIDQPKIELTYSGLVMPYGDGDLGQHWFR